MVEHKPIPQVEHVIISELAAYIPAEQLEQQYFQQQQNYVTAEHN